MWRMRRKSQTGPALAFPSENLFDPPDLRRRITRKPGTSTKEAAKIAPRPRLMSSDRSSKDTDEAHVDIELHPRDENWTWSFSTTSKSISRGDAAPSIILIAN